MWKAVKYESTAFFSLRPHNATSSGGKTLLTPTPFAFKMALLDAAIRTYGLAQGETWFPVIRDLEIAIRLPPHILVNNTFIKILRPHKNGPKDACGTGLIGPMVNTIAYREMVQYPSPLWIAFQNRHTPDIVSPIDRLAPQINYLGKRGGFMQYLDKESIEHLSGEYTHLNPSGSPGFLAHGILQLLDDCGPNMTFEHANIFSAKGIKTGDPAGRLINPIVLPYHLARSSRAFSLYELDN